LNPKNNFLLFFIFIIYLPEEHSGDAPMILQAAAGAISR
jgi:hypothetical protein